MTQRRLPGLYGPAALVTFLLVAAPGHGDDKEKPNSWPKGSEKAVASVLKEFPEAQIDEVAEPRGFGSSGGKGTPLFWAIHFHVGEKKQELSVLPEGGIIRLPVPVEVKDLPKAVADGVTRAAPGAKVQAAEKNEMRATMKYVALDSPQVRQYAIDVVKDEKRSRVTLNGDGGNAKVTEIKEEKANAPADRPAEKEIDIPEKAARAVKAIKALYPDGTVKQITTEVFDDGTGEIEILTYEIEFITKGTKREMVASPEGIIPHLWAPVEAKALPKGVTDALDKAVPGSRVEKARAFEIRASLRFGPLEKPKVYYTVHVAQDDKKQVLKLKPNGEVIKDRAFPKKDR
jgi:hypothetical protein